MKLKIKLNISIKGHIPVTYNHQLKYLTEVRLKFLWTYLGRNFMVRNLRKETGCLITSDINTYNPSMPYIQLHIYSYVHYSQRN